MQKEIVQFKAHLQCRYPERSTTKHYMSDLAIFKRFVGDIPAVVKSSGGWGRRRAATPLSLDSSLTFSVTVVQSDGRSLFERQNWNFQMEWA